MKRVKVVAIIIAVLAAVSCIVALYMVQAGAIELPNPHGSSAIIEAVRWVV